MIYYAIGEPEYEASNWYKSIFDGLINEKRQKRISLCVINSADELDSIDVGCEDAVFVIGSESEWLENTTAALAERFDNRVVVLGNHTRGTTDVSYSVVTADISSDVRMLVEYLISIGKTRIALYGINPSSTSDSYKKTAFLSFGFSERDLFYNSGSLGDCYERFICHKEEYDAVICVNDYAAISLIKRMGERRIAITALGASKLASYTPVSITHTYRDYRDYAGAGIDLARLLVKNPTISSVEVLLRGGFSTGDSTDNLAFDTNASHPIRRSTRGDERFYSDSEICEMIAIENMLERADNEDMEIIASLLAGATYESIAQSRYISTNGIKYKLKNIYEMCASSGRGEFEELVRKYVDPKKLIERK